MSGRAVISGLQQPDLVAAIFQQLSFKDRARCELVCRTWWAVSRECGALWSRVLLDDSPSEQHTAAMLKWLGGRGPVYQAKLVFKQGAICLHPQFAFSLGRWSHTLQALSLTAGTLPSIAFLAVLEQLTWLKVDARVGAKMDEVESWLPPNELHAVSGLRRLHTLSWKVDFEDADGWPLPLFPTGLQQLQLCAHKRSSPWFSGPLSSLRHLEVLEVLWADMDRDSLAQLRELGSLTLLNLETSYLAELPLGLSTCTALRCLLTDWIRGEGEAPLAVLTQLRSLETLGLWGNCYYLSLPPLLGSHHHSPLKALAIGYGEPSFSPNAGWLSSLEYLSCRWRQLPAEALLTAAAHLRVVRIESHQEDQEDAEVVARGLRMLNMLPALEVLCLEPSHATWSNAALTAFAALCRSKPALRLANAESGKWSWHRPGKALDLGLAWPWPDTRTMFDLSWIGAAV